jgi:hypothetical protein
MTARFHLVAVPESTGTASITSESCQPANGAIDPLEQVTLDIQLQNVGTVDADNLVATLQPTGGVTQPTGPQTYGLLQAGGPAITRSFSFLADGTCGGSLTVTLQLQDGATDLGNLNFTYTLGLRQVTISENFDAVTAPALPAGWTATVDQGTTTPWATSTTTSDTPANAVFATDPTTVSDNYLISPSIAIATASARLTFRHKYALEANYDGGVLEIAIGAGSFTDILAAGGSFSAGEYDAVISTDYQSPIGNRNAWTGSSGEFITTTVNLPTTAAGQGVRFRWRLGTDNSYGDDGWYVDTITIEDEITCCQSIPDDMDGDGVPDSQDNCPNTVPGATVDANGCPPIIPGDFDRDGDVGPTDRDAFSACMSGPTIAVSAGCETKDLDGDGDADQSDFGILQACLSGEDNPTDPNCAPPPSMPLIPAGKF